MIRILLIDSNIENFSSLERNLQQFNQFQLFYESDIEKAISILKTRPIDLIIYTLNKAYSLKNMMIQQLLQSTSAFIIQGKPENQEYLNWIEAGAQDFFSIEEISSNEFYKIIIFSLARQKHLNELHALSLTDELTHCYNRRGFDLLLTQQISIGKRMNRSFILFSIDLDKLKKINDDFGHLMGDIALKDTSYILHQSFRSYDIIARFGGDEFMVCVVDTKQDHLELLEKQIQKNILLFREEYHRPYTLSLSIGSTVFDSSSPVSKEKLYEDVDQSLYRSKRSLRPF